LARPVAAEVMPPPTDERVEELFLARMARLVRAGERLDVGKPVPELSAERVMPPRALEPEDARQLVGACREHVLAIRRVGGEGQTLRAANDGGQILGEPFERAELNERDPARRQRFDVVQRRVLKKTEGVRSPLREVRAEL